MTFGPSRRSSCPEGFEKKTPPAAGPVLLYCTGPLAKANLPAKAICIFLGHLQKVHSPCSLTCRLDLGVRPCPWMLVVGVIATGTVQTRRIQPKHMRPSTSVQQWWLLRMRQTMHDKVREPALMPSLVNHMRFPLSDDQTVADRSEAAFCDFLMARKH